ncbi:MAG TPA: signal transduction protein [Euryarchaeota archaeon]|nr:signal transduction protein [Euryarchaeota archaeon]
MDSIDGMDNIFHNDIYQGAIIIVYGPPGSLKSGLVFSILSRYLEKSGEFGMYLTIEENTISHLRNMDSLGIKVPENLLISDYSDIRSRFEVSSGDTHHPDFLEMVDGVIKFFKDKEGDNFTCFGLDSLGGLYSLIETGKLRSKMFHFFKKLREYNLTSFIIMETPRFSNIIEGQGSEMFLADGIIEMGPIEHQHDIHLYMQVLKMRSCSHSRKKHLIDIGENGISILSPVVN